MTREEYTSFKKRLTGSGLPWLAFMALVDQMGLSFDVAMQVIDDLEFKNTHRTTESMH